MTREEAIDILFGVIQANSEEENEALDMAIKALEQTQWTPTADHLPDLTRKEYYRSYHCEQMDFVDDLFMLSDPVLVYRDGEDIDPDDRILVAQYEDDLDGRTYWQTVDAEVIYGVVAWMPLPEPYRKDEA